MLFLLLSCIYISCFSWAWGLLLLGFLKRSSGDNTYAVPHFSIVCLTGLAALTIVAGILSLFIPLGGWEVQIIVVLPGILLFFQRNRHLLAAELRRSILKLSPAALFLFIVCCLLALLMSSWKVNHPDTLYYHAQTIQWIEKYKAVPGIVHLHVRYGYQGLWFVSSALFGFRFSGIETVTTLNFTVLSWFFLFVAYNIHKYCFEKTEAKPLLLWLALLAISMMSYTQVRLTATSASPDFIAALYVWLIFYLLIKSETLKESPTHKIIIIFLSVFAITIKLSTAPVIIITLLLLYQLLRLKKIKAVLVALLFTIVTIIPFIARNVISSGYVSFPSVIPDITNVDWKFSNELTILEKDYITAYAKGIRDGSRKDAQVQERSKAFTEWLPDWWIIQSLPDKMLLVLAALSFAGILIKIKKAFQYEEVKVATICAMAGMLFWFIQAPDPRFGFGFIIALPAIALTRLYSFPFIVTQRISLSVTILTGILISAYIIYRSVFFFTPRQLLLPEGLVKSSYSTIRCNDTIFNIPEKGSPCGDTKVPCTYHSCDAFEKRGTKITDGFRAK